MVTQVILPEGHLSCLQTGHHQAGSCLCHRNSIHITICYSMMLPQGSRELRPMHCTTAGAQQFSVTVTPPGPDPVIISHCRAPGGGHGDPTADAYQERCRLCDPEEAQVPHTQRYPEDPATPVLYQWTFLQPQGDVPILSLLWALKLGHREPA